jgi:predicted CoA-binding protein
VKAQALQHPKRLKPQEHTVVVLGASPKPTRYSYQAVTLLHDHGYRVIPVHPKVSRIDRVRAVSDLGNIAGPVHTLTMYVGPARSKEMIGAIVDLAPQRVILNPGTESRDLELALKDARIPYEHACTLVLLRTGQF